MGYCTTLNQCRMSSPTFGPHSGKLCIGSIWPAACCWGRTNEPRRPHTRQFFVPFLGYLSDPFKGYSWPPTGDQKGHGLNHKGQFPTANVSLSCQARRMYPQLIDLKWMFLNPWNSRILGIFGRGVVSEQSCYLRKIKQPAQCFAMLRRLDDPWSWLVGSCCFWNHWIVVFSVATDVYNEDHIV